MSGDGKIAGGNVLWRATAATGSGWRKRDQGSGLEYFAPLSADSAPHQAVRACPGRQRHGRVQRRPVVQPSIRRRSSGRRRWARSTSTSSCASQGTAFEQFASLWTPKAMSDDGSVMAGWGIGTQYYAGWVLQMPKVFVCHLERERARRGAHRSVEVPEGLRRAPDARRHRRALPGPPGVMRVVVVIAGSGGERGNRLRMAGERRGGTRRGLQQRRWRDSTGCSAPGHGRPRPCARGAVRRAGLHPPGVRAHRARGGPLARGCRARALRVPVQPRGRPYRLAAAPETPIRAMDLPAGAEPRGPGHAVRSAPVPVHPLGRRGRAPEPLRPEHPGGGPARAV